MTQKKSLMNNEKWEQLSGVAWKYRENARILGKTKVGVEDTAVIFVML
jgi:hypothetical protein